MMKWYLPNLSINVEMKCTMRTKFCWTPTASSCLPLPLLPWQRSFTAAVRRYEGGDYGGAVALFEEALEEYFKADVECRALCQSPQRFEGYDFLRYRYSLHEVVSGEHQAVRTQHAPTVQVSPHRWKVHSPTLFNADVQATYLYCCVLSTLLTHFIVTYNVGDFFFLSGFFSTKIFFLIVFESWCESGSFMLLAKRWGVFGRYQVNRWWRPHTCVTVPHGPQPEPDFVMLRELREAYKRPNNVPRAQ